ncbi:MAG: hypothetical protein H7841_01895 [Magnetospirillum sp. WYHS-4]
MFEIAHGIVTIAGLKLTFAQAGIILVVFVAIGVLGEEVARYKGHSPILWLAICSLMPLALLAILVMPAKPKKGAAAKAVKRSARSRPGSEEDDGGETVPKVKVATKVAKARR